MVRELMREVWAKPPLFFGASLVVLVFSSLLILLVVLAVTPRRDADQPPNAIPSPHAADPDGNWAADAGRSVLAKRERVGEASQLLKRLCFASRPAGTGCQTGKSRSPAFQKEIATPMFRFTAGWLGFAKHNPAAGHHLISTFSAPLRLCDFASNQSALSAPSAVHLRLHSALRICPSPFPSFPPVHLPLSVLSRDDPWLKHSTFASFATFCSFLLLIRTPQSAFEMDQSSPFHCAP